MAEIDYFLRKKGPKTSLFSKFSGHFLKVLSASHFKFSKGWLDFSSAHFGGF